MTSVAPFLVFFAGAALAAVTSGRLRQVILLAVPLVGAVNLFYLLRCYTGHCSRLDISTHRVPRRLTQTGSPTLCSRGDPSTVGRPPAAQQRAAHCPAFDSDM